MAACLAWLGVRPRHTVAAPLPSPTSSAAETTVVYRAIGLPPGINLTSSIGAVAGTIDLRQGKIHLTT